MKCRRDWEKMNRVFGRELGSELLLACKRPHMSGTNSSHFQGSRTHVAASGSTSIQHMSSAPQSARDQRNVTSGASWLLNV